MDYSRTHSGRCTCLRNVVLPCHVAKFGLLTLTQSANGRLVMPADVRAFPGFTRRVHLPMHPLCRSLMDKNY